MLKTTQNIIGQGNVNQPKNISMNFENQILENPQKSENSQKIPQISKIQALNYKSNQNSTNILYVEGHRGAGGFQNNLNAFQSAIDNQLDCIELDVWLTKDEKLAITHGDDDGNIKKHGKLVPITSLTLQELQQIYEEENQILNEFVKKHMNREESIESQNSLSTCDSPLRKTQNETEMSNKKINKEQIKQQNLKEKLDQIHNNRIPELSQVLDLVKGKIRLNIEIKNGINKPLLVKLIIDEVYGRNMEEQVHFSSFNYEFYDLLIKYMKEYNYYNGTERLIMPFGFLVEHEIPQRLLNNSDDEYLLFGNSLNFPAEFLEQQDKIEQIKQIQQKNKYMSLKCWFSFSTMETEQIYNSLRELGCYTIITNDAYFINQYKIKNNLI